MNRLKPLFITTIICLPVVGCEKPAGSAGNTFEPNGADVARALGMNWWKVRLPADLGPDDVVDVAYKNPDGSIKNGGGIGGWKSGAIVKVFVWESDDGKRLRYAVLNESSDLRGSLPKKPNTKSASPFSDGKLVNADAILMKWSEGSITVLPPDVRPGEVGLVLHVTKAE